MLSITLTFSGGWGGQSMEPKTAKSHYHIQWSGRSSVDWQRFETAQEAGRLADELVGPDESYTIKEFTEDACPACERNRAQAKSLLSALNPQLRSEALKKSS
jgi:hypothetical protein